jgi:hypothetical protein
MKLEEYVTLEEAAKRLGYANTTMLRQYSREGRIAGAVKLAHAWFVPRVWVEDAAKNWPFAKTRPKYSEQ